MKSNGQRGTVRANSSRMSAASESLKEAVLGALSQIRDPDLHQDIVTLGFVKDLEIRPGLLGSEISLTLELTTPACPIKESFQKDAIQRLSAIPGVSKAEVRMSSRVQTPKGGKKVPGVRNLLAVGSGKGGVGKSSVAVNVAGALKSLGSRVGLLDADIYGPSLAMMMGVSATPKVRDGKILPVTAHGVPLMTFAFFAPVGEAVIWRGSMIGKAVEQMLFDVDWLGDDSNPQREEIDYLVIDLPPGTGDVHLTLSHTVDLNGALIVSTPQDVAMLDAARGIAMFEKLKVPVLGIVENMSGFVCPHCHEKTEVFGEGVVEARARERDWPFLGHIPLDTEIARRGDRGAPVSFADPSSPLAQAFRTVAQQVAHRLSVANLKGGSPEASS
jgi:ATP-binding protein involved in chromosome partitioning